MDENIEEKIYKVDKISEKDVKLVSPREPNIESRKDISKKSTNNITSEVYVQNIKNIMKDNNCKQTQTDKVKEVSMVSIGVGTSSTETISENEVKTITSKEVNTESPKKVSKLPLNNVVSEVNEQNAESIVNIIDNFTKQTQTEKLVNNKQTQFVKIQFDKLTQISVTFEDKETQKVEYAEEKLDKVEKRNQN